MNDADFIHAISSGGAAPIGAVDRPRVNAALLLLLA